MTLLPEKGRGEQQHLAEHIYVYNQEQDVSNKCQGDHSRSSWDVRQISEETRKIPCLPQIMFLKDMRTLRGES